MEPQATDPPELWGTVWSFVVVYGIWVALLFLVILGLVALMIWPRKQKPGENIG